MEKEQCGGRWGRQPGRAGQANCTLLAAGRSLMVVMGGCLRDQAASQHLTAPGLGSPWGGRASESCPPYRARAPGCWDGRAVRGLSPPSTGTHSPRLVHTSQKVPPCAALAWLLETVWWAFCLTGGSALGTEGSEGSFSWSICAGQSLVLRAALWQVYPWPHAKSFHMRSGHPP